MLREYICKNCKETLELIAKFEDEPQTKCPFCGEEKLELVKFPLSSFILKGKGWFKSGGY